MSIKLDSVLEEMQLKAEEEDLKLRKSLRSKRNRREYRGRRHQSRTYLHNIKGLPFTSLLSEMEEMEWLTNESQG